MLHYARMLTIERLYLEKKPQVFIPEIKQIIKFSKNFVEQKGAKFYFVYIPDSARYQNKFSVDKKFYIYDKIIQIVEDLNIPIIDLHKEGEKTSKTVSLREGRRADGRMFLLRI